MLEKFEPLLYHASKTQGAMIITCKDVGTKEIIRNILKKCSNNFRFSKVVSIQFEKDVHVKLNQKILSDSFMLNQLKNNIP